TKFLISHSQGFIVATCRKQLRYGSGSPPQMRSSGEVKRGIMGRRSRRGYGSSAKREQGRLLRTSEALGVAGIRWLMKRLGIKPAFTAFPKVGTAGSVEGSR